MRYQKLTTLEFLFELAEPEGFYRENLDILREIELAYTASRYLRENENSLQKPMKLRRK